MNLRYKLFTAFLGLIIIPLFTLGMIMFFVTYNSIEKKYSQQSSIHSKRSATASPMCSKI